MLLQFNDETVFVLFIIYQCIKSFKRIFSFTHIHTQNLNNFLYITEDAPTLFNNFFL